MQKRHSIEFKETLSTSINQVNLSTSKTDVPELKRQLKKYWPYSPRKRSEYYGYESNNTNFST